MIGDADGGRGAHRSMRRRSNWNQSNFLNSIDQHLWKSNDSVIDLTGFAGDQITVVRNYVNGLSAAEQTSIVRIGF